MTCSHCADAAAYFDDRQAGKELATYRRKGPSATTRALLDALIAQGVDGGTVLDIGGGIGAIQHELAARGAAEIVAVEASAAYLHAARDEADRRGHAGRVRELAGDFVELADQVPEADVVTLDRVVCCYPDATTLVTLSARKARRVYGLVYPRRRLVVRVFMALQNLVFRLRRSAFRVYIHQPSAIEAAARAAGLAPAFRTRTFIWEVAVFAR